MSSEAVTGFFGAQCVCRACKPTWPSHPPGPRTLYTVSVAPEGLELRSRSLWSVPRCLLVAPVASPYWLCGLALMYDGKRVGGLVPQLRFDLAGGIALWRPAVGRSR